MDITNYSTNLLMDVFEASIKAYSIIFRRPYVAVKVQFAPRRDSSGRVTEELIAFTISNERGPDIEIQRAWFLTSFNRPVSSEFIDSKMPVIVSKKDNATYFVPMGELKTLLNKNVGETITQAVVFDKNGRKYEGRVDKAVQGEFAK